MGGCGNQRQAEGTCFREPVDEIEGGTGGRWKEQICSALLTAKGCGRCFHQWKSSPSGREEAMVEKQRDRNTTDTHGVRLEGSSVSERHSGDGLQSLRSERDSGQGAEGGDGPQRGSGQQCVHQGNAGSRPGTPWAIV
eukprot:bmy_07813T0